jgi:hypothetical protein
VVVSALLALSYCPEAKAQAATVGVETCSVAYARGQEERLAGRLYNARSAFQQCSSSACSPELVRDCGRWLQEVEADLPTVRVSVHAPNGAAISQLSVTIDGQTLPQSALSAPIVLEAGPHELRFEAPGYESVQLEKALRPSDREVNVAVTLRPPPPPAPAVEKAESRKVPLASWILAGVGTAALGTSIYFGVKAKGEYRDLERDCAPRCDPATTATMHDHAVISDIALGGSLLVFATAAVVYFLEPTSPRTTTSAQARSTRVVSLKGNVSRGGGQVAAQLSF